MMTKEEFLESQLGKKTLLFLEEKGFCLTEENLYHVLRFAKNSQSCIYYFSLCFNDEVKVVFSKTVNGYVSTTIVFHYSDVLTEFDDSILFFDELIEALSLGKGNMYFFKRSDERIQCTHRETSIIISKEHGIEIEYKNNV